MIQAILALPTIFKVVGVLAVLIPLVAGPAKCSYDVAYSRGVESNKKEMEDYKKKKDAEVEKITKARDQVILDFKTYRETQERILSEAERKANTERAESRQKEKDLGLRLDIVTSQYLDQLDKTKETTCTLSPTAVTTINKIIEESNK